MLPSNIETEVKEILKKRGGWCRTEECAKVYAKGNMTKRTRFYRWRKKVDKGKVDGFQHLPLGFNNISYIGLQSADPNKLLESIMSDRFSITSQCFFPELGKDMRQV